MLYYHVYECQLCKDIFLDEVSKESYGSRFMVLHKCDISLFENIQGSSGNAIGRFKCETEEEAVDRLNFIRYFKSRK